MLVKTTARHFELTPELKVHVEERLSRLKKYGYPLLEAHVILSVEKYRHIAEITLHGDGLDVAGRDESADMYAAIDQVVEKLESQVKRHKDKLITKKNASAGKRTLEP
jgi:putative sigma-54 modulation protein